MESFFLAETTKYLYLMFDPDNFIHNNGHSGTVVNTPSGQCLLDAGTTTFVSFSVILVSQGSIATYVRCGGMST